MLVPKATCRKSPKETPRIPASTSPFQNAWESLSGLLGGDVNCTKALKDGRCWTVTVLLACYLPPKRRIQVLIHTPKPCQLAGYQSTPTLSWRLLCWDEEDYGHRVTNSAITLPLKSLEFISSVFGKTCHNSSPLFVIKRIARAIKCILSWCAAPRIVGGTESSWEVRVP